MSELADDCCYLWSVRRIDERQMVIDVKYVAVHSASRDGGPRQFQIERETRVASLDQHDLDIGPTWAMVLDKLNEWRVALGGCRRCSCRAASADDLCSFGQ